MKKLVILAAAISVLVTCTQSAQSSKRPDPQLKTSSLKLLWLSLDGLVYSDVKDSLKKLSNPHPKGFKYLLEQGNWNNNLEVTNPTITSSSHVSTITCTPPSEHGVLANGQWMGDGMKNGFMLPYSPETFVHAIRKNGLKVVSLSYPTIDGQTDARSANAGATYDEPESKYIVLEIPNGESQAVSIPSRTRKNETVIFTGDVAKDGNEVVWTLPGGEKVFLKAGKWENLDFIQDDTRQQVAALYISNTHNTARLFLGPTAINSGYPKSFLKSLDDKKIVFSNAKNYDLPKLAGEEAYMGALAHRSTYFTQVAHQILDNENPDAFFLYYEDLDTVGHAYAGLQEMESLKLAHFALLDAELGSIFEKIPSTTEVVVMGDHGMTAAQYELNVGSIISRDLPVKTFTSGGALFIYPKWGLSSPAPTNEKWFKDLLKDLSNKRIEFDGNKKMLAAVVVKGSEEAKKLGLNFKDSPWIMGFASEGVSLKYSVEKDFLLTRRQQFNIPIKFQAKYPDKFNGKTLLQPSIMGVHGNFSALNDMKTALLMFGPKLNRVDAKKISMNTEVVPAVADGLNLPRPKGCAK